MILNNPSKNQQLYETLCTLYTQFPDPKEYNWIRLEWGENPRYPDILTSHTIHLMRYMLYQYVDYVDKGDPEEEEDVSTFQWSEWPSCPNDRHDELYCICVQLIAYLNKKDVPSVKTWH